MTDYILIDVTSRRPVPLPYHTKLIKDDSEVTVYNFTDEDVSIRRNGRSYRSLPQLLGLAIITEADFMKEQNDD